MTYDPSPDIARMKYPGQMRGSAIHGVIQIIVTNRCDDKCSNCTQQIAYQRDRWFITPDNFRRACESLREYPGIVGVFGGNPCLHPQFPDLCRIAAEVLPDKRRRGLWSNNIFGHGDVIRETFGYFNLNVHTKHANATTMRAGLPGVTVWGEDQPSRHAPVLVAIKDMIPDEREMWRRISECDVNHRWSAAVTQQDGELRAYFCEVAASFAGMYQDAGTGLPVTDGWWRLGMERWQDQAKRWCPGCGVPLRLRGQLDTAHTDDVSRSHLDRVELTVRGTRAIKVHDSLDGEPISHEATDYQRLRG